MKEFLILTILNKIIENKEYAKHPILIVIPEIRKLCPDRAYGYQKYLSEAIKDALSTMRNIGEGFASILSSQSWNDTSQEVKDSHSVTLLGKLNINDIDKISKILGYSRDIKNILVEPDSPNSWLLLGSEAIGSFHFCLPSWGHAEPHYTFEKKFEEEYPDRVFDYSDIINGMKDQLKEEEKVFRDKMEKEQRAERDTQKRKEEAKKNNSVDVKEQIKKVKIETQLKDMKRAYEMREIQKMTLDDIGEKLGVGRDTVKRWSNKYKESLEGNSPKQILE